MTFTIAFRADGTLTTFIDILGMTDEDSGTYTVDGNALEMLISGDVVSGTVSVAGDVMELFITTGIEWDFAETGIDVPATWDLELARS